MLVSCKALGKNVCKLFGGISLANTNVATHVGVEEMVLHSNVFGTMVGIGRFCSQS